MDDYSKVYLVRKSTALWPMHSRKEQENQQGHSGTTVEMIPEFP